ncbi:hypothetical protein AB0I28_14875 [Phytomonospora sp. NPDC050363]|uniref:hypothetical protein n=1 Tax=Phytomonospora sp. NPDC050363 TaxID=3155642 RepID=UPI0033EE09D4
MRPAPERAANTLAALLASCALLTGCAAPPGPSPAGPSLSGLSVPADPAAALPLAAYRHDLAGLRLVESARDTLAAECMTRLGHPGWTPPPLPTARPWDSGMSIGLLDADHAAAHGYRAPADTRNTEAPTPDGQRLAYLGPLPGEPPAPGIPYGGCAAEADQAFGPPPDLSLVASLTAAAEDAVATDPRAVESLGEWSTCMSEKGHEYELPGEAQYQYWPRTVTDVERALATADVACKTRSRLGEVWFELLSGYQAELADDNADALKSVADALAAERARARDVVTP